METHHYIAIGCLVIVGFLAVLIVGSIVSPGSWPARVLARIFDDKDD